MSLSLVKEHYQVLVLGCTPGAAACAALLAKAGLRVCLAGTVGSPLPREESCSVSRPFFAPSPDSSPSLGRILYELKLQQDYADSLDEPDPMFQFLGQGFRIEVRRSVPRLNEELSREFGEAARKEFERLLEASESMASEFDSFLDETASFPWIGFWDRLAAQRALKKSPWRHVLKATAKGRGRDAVRVREGVTAGCVDLDGISPAIKTLAWAVPSFLGGLDSNGLPSASALCRTISWLGRGVFFFRGGETGLTRILCKRLESKGGQVSDIEVDNLDTDWSGPCVARGKKGEEIKFEWMVAACRPERFAAMLSEPRASAKISTWSAGITVGTYMGGVELIMDAGGLPEPLAPRAFLVSEPGTPLHDGNLVYLETARDEGRGGQGGLVRLKVFGLFSSSRKPGSERELDQVLRERIKVLLPFLDEHLKSSEPVRWDGFRDEATFLDPLAPKEPVPFEQAVAVRSPFRNTLFLHPWTVPGLGMESEMLSALRITRFLERKLKGTTKGRA